MSSGGRPRSALRIATSAGQVGSGPRQVGDLLGRWRAPSTRGGHMTDSVALGLNGLSIPTGTHICALFRGTAERDEIMIPYLLEGLRSGDKCICLIDDEVEAVRTAISGDAGAPGD